MPALAAQLGEMIGYKVSLLYLLIIYIIYILYICTTSWTKEICGSTEKGIFKDG